MENKQKLATLKSIKKWVVNISAYCFIIMIGVLFLAIWWETMLMLKIGGSLFLVIAFCVVYISGLNKGIDQYAREIALEDIERELQALEERKSFGVRIRRDSLN